MNKELYFLLSENTESTLFIHVQENLRNWRIAKKNKRGCGENEQMDT